MLKDSIRILIKFFSTIKFILFTLLSNLFKFLKILNNFIIDFIEICKKSFPTEHYIYFKLILKNLIFSIFRFIKWLFYTYVIERAGKVSAGVW